MTGVLVNVTSGDQREYECLGGLEDLRAIFREASTSRAEVVDLPTEFGHVLIWLARVETIELIER